MKSYIEKILAVVLSLCLLLCFPVSASAEDWADFPHPYLRGIISEETGEVTITGFKPLGIDQLPRDVVIPDEIDGHPVTEIADQAFYFESPDSKNYRDLIRSVVIGDNVRRIGRCAFGWNHALETVSFGKNVQTICWMAFEDCHLLRVLNWGNSLQKIQDFAFDGAGAYLEDPLYVPCPPLPSTIEIIGYTDLAFPDNYVIPASVKEYHAHAIHSRSLIVLSKDMAIAETEYVPLIYPTSDDPDAYYIYCYSDSTAEENALIHGYTYYLIDGDSLLWNGEAVEGNALQNCVGMTETELLTHLSIDGTSSEIQIDGLQDGKVANGTTVTLFHTVAQAPGKVYTVRTPGDADGDGERTLLDVAQLVRFIAGGWDVTIDLLNADVNADGLVNLKDAALLRRFLAGWDVKLQ